MSRWSFELGPAPRYRKIDGNLRAGSRGPVGYRGVREVTSRRAVPVQRGNFIKHGETLVSCATRSKTPNSDALPIIGQASIATLALLKAATVRVSPSSAGSRACKPGFGGTSSGPSSRTG
jgi:hypothetical protein